MQNLAIIGYGAQARAWAANLRDSGPPPTIFLRGQGPRWHHAQCDNFSPKALGPELGEYRHFALLIPDHAHGEFLRTWGGHLPAGSLIILAHGQSFIAEDLAAHFPRPDFALLAPKAIAGEVRRRCREGEKLGACFSLEGVKRDAPERERFLRTLATRLGVTGLFASTFAEEARADLFSEQSLLCSSIPYMALHSYNKLREKGHSREVAYMECWMEVKLIADTMISQGPKKLFELISPMALLGGERAREKLCDGAYLDKLEKIYCDIESGEFFRQADSTDFDQVRKDVVHFWEQQELTQTHEELSSTL